MEKIRIRQTRSSCGHPKRQKKTLSALGLKKTNNVVEVEATPQILGMIEKVHHLVKVEKL